MPESLQHKLDRVRRPRVQITYDVETGGAMAKVELSFVAGVLADLSGQPKQPLAPFKDRKAITIDRDNFNEVLAKSGARVTMRVPNRLTDPNSKLAVELNFKHIDDFGPARVAEQIGPLKQLLEMRYELLQLLNRMEGNDKLGQLLESILANQDKATALGQLLDSQAQSEAAAEPSAAPVPPAPAKSSAPAPAKAPAAPRPSPPAPTEAQATAPEAAPAAQPAGPATAPAPSQETDPDLDALLKQTENKP